jgi:hypothetical protein
MGYSEFELNIPEALRRELPLHFNGFEPTPLTERAVAAIPDKAQGAYLLFHNDQLVYVGKTDSQAGFRTRLGRHLNNVRHRKFLDPSKVSFKAARIFVFSNFDLETMLIEEYTSHYGIRPVWNFSGFGSNDPGHNREDQHPAQFDLDYPVNIDIDLDFLKPGRRPLLEVLVELKDGLPYLLRYETDPGAHYRIGHADMRGATVDIPPGPITARQALKLILRSLPNGWQVTVFPNRTILYKEDRIYRSQVEAITNSSP